MAKATFDITTIELPAAAAKPLYAGVGATDLAVEYVRGTVADVQKRFAEVQRSVQDFEPASVRAEAVKRAKARRAAVEARVADLQSDAKAIPTRVQDRVNDNVAVVSSTYADLAKRGETLVTRIRKQESTQATVAAAKTTEAKAKTTTTQAKKTAKTTSTQAKKATSTAKKTVKKSPAKKSAKATSTAAKKTAANATQAATEAAAKVGD